MTKYMSHCSPDLRNQPQIGILGQLQPTTPDTTPGTAQKPDARNQTRSSRVATPKLLNYFIIVDKIYYKIQILT